MRTVAAGVALLLAALVGCSSDEPAPVEVGPLASASAGASAEATPARGESVRPPAGGVDPAGEPPPSAGATANAADAATFARHYMAVMQTALAESDPRPLQQLSDPGCGGCSNILSAIRQAAQAGHKVQGAELVVVFAEAPAIRNGETIVDLRYERRSGAIVDDDGEEVDSIAAEGPIDTQLRVRLSGTAWSVLGFREVPA